MVVTKKVLNRFLHKEIAVIFDDGGKTSFVRGIIISNDNNGFILKYKNTEQYFSYECIKRIREIFKGEKNDR